MLQTYINLTAGKDAPGGNIVFNSEWITDNLFAIGSIICGIIGLGFIARAHKVKFADILVTAGIIVLAVAIMTSLPVVRNGAPALMHSLLPAFF